MGATRVEQIEQNLQSCEWRLTLDDLAKVDELCTVAA